MFGTLVEDEGSRDRRWGSVVGVRMGRMGGRSLRGYVFNTVTGGYDWVDEGSSSNYATEAGGVPNTTGGGTPSTGSDYLLAVLDTLKTVAPSVLGVVQTAINRGAMPQSGNCPPGYAYYSPIVGRCFRTPQEMAMAEQAVQQAGQQYNVSSPNTMLLVGAGLLGVVGLVLFLKK